MVTEMGRIDLALLNTLRRNRPVLLIRSPRARLSVRVSWHRRPETITALTNALLDLIGRRLVEIGSPTFKSYGREHAVMLTGRGVSFVRERLAQRRAA